MPYVYIVYDLEPNRTLALGVVKENSPAAKMLAKAQREWLHGAVLESELAYWRGRLGGAPPVLELPLDRPRPAVMSRRGPP